MTLLSRIGGSAWLRKESIVSRAAVLQDRRLHRALTMRLVVNAIDRLLAVEDIRNLKAGYFRCMDTKAWTELATLFTADMRVLSPNGEPWLSGGAAFAASLKQSLQFAVSCHQGFTAEIEIVDTTNAKAIWAMQDVIEWEHGHPREGWKSLIGRGHYHDTYRKTAGKWQIATLSLTRLRLDVT